MLAERVHLGGTIWISPSPSRPSDETRRLIDPRRPQRLACRLRPQLIEDRSQGPNAIAERVLGSTDELDQLDGFFIRQFKVRHNPDMGWRSTNVPTRWSVADALIARWPWPRSFARWMAETLPRAYRDRPVRPLRAIGEDQERLGLAPSPPARASPARPDRGLDGTGDRGARTKPEPTASYLPPSDFWRVAVQRRTSIKPLIFLVRARGLEPPRHL